MGKHPIVEAIKAEATRNQVFRDICLMWSQRQRTRGRLTVTRIKQAMEQEGFMSYNRKQYEDVLTFLGKIGLGTLERSKRGKAKSLSGVKIKLQSIGQAALGGGTQLERRTEVNHYEELVSNTPETVAKQNTVHKNDIVETAAPKQRAKVKQPAVSQTKTAQPVPVRKEEFPVFLTMIIGDKVINIPADTKVNSENMSEIIAKFRKLSKTELDL